MPRASHRQAVRLAPGWRVGTHDSSIAIPQSFCRGCGIVNLVGLPDC